LETSLLFIPDITGFSFFVNNTAVVHSQHIISELLELIIDENDLKLKVSEVEGDAVVFYKHGAVPTVEEIITQAERMFLAFHNYLKYYETRRVCDCGACSSASGLTLKFIVHAGVLGFTEIKKHSKPFGPALVKVHRLLKNNINHPEYILFSDYFKSEIRKINLSVQVGSTKYDEIGIVEYYYLNLSYLLEKLKSVNEPATPAISSKPIKVGVDVDRDIDLVLEVISNLEMRNMWNKGPKELDFEKERVNKIGTRHTCIFPANELEIETVKADKNGADKVFAEEAKNFKLGKSLLLFYYLHKIDEAKTHVEFQLHLIPYPYIGTLIRAIVLPNLKKQLKKSAETFKLVAETLDKNRQPIEFSKR